MNKRLIHILVALTAGMISACSLPEADLYEPEVRYELNAILESGAETRTHLSESESGIYYPYWTGEEELAVFINERTIPLRFTFVSGKDTREAVFSGPGTGNHYVALYPNGAEGSLSESDLTLILPAEQSYKPGTFGEGAFPMLAVGFESTLSFKNLCSVLKVSLTGSASVQAITFKANDPGTAVSGKARVRIDNPENPVLTMFEDGSSSVRLACGSVALSETTPTDFFVVIPPGTYKGGFTLGIKTSDGTVTRSTQEDIVFERSQIRSVPAFECTGAEVDPEDIPDNMLLYSTTDGSLCRFWEDSFDRKIVSHTLENGRGKIVFDGPLKKVGSGFVDVRGYCIVTDIIFPPTVEEIGYYAFSNSPLKSVRLPKNLKSVHYFAFNRCPQLERFYGPNASSDGKAIVIDGEMVAYAGVVDEVMVIPEGVRSIKDFCIADCLTEEASDKVKEIIFPEGLVGVGRPRKDYSNLSLMKNLEYITLPSTFSNIEDTYGTFIGFPNLKKFKGSCPYIQDDGNCLIDEYGCLFAYAGAGISAYAVPEGVRDIAGYVFSGKDDIRGLSLPTTIDYIPKPMVAGKNLSYFFGPLASEDGHSLVRNGKVEAVITNLEEYVSPENITCIASSAFLSSYAKRIIIRDCVTSIEGDSFAWVNCLETLVLSKSLKSVGSYSFGNNQDLHAIYFRSPAPPSCGNPTSNVAFPSDFVAYVPKGSLEAYQNASQWSFLPRNFQEYEPEDIVAPGWYTSTDYSCDGKVEILQRASEGNGIDIVLIGDAFSDRQIADGTYGKVIAKMKDAFFSIEPYKSYQKYFNVYRVDVVSETEGYAHPGQALGTCFKGGAKVAGNDDSCMGYARRALSDDRMDNALILVAMDSTAYAGTCYMYSSSAYSGDWGEGFSVAYFPLGKSDKTLAQLVHHEAGGHGFAKLEDEYGYESNGAIPEEAVENAHWLEYLGWSKNVDFTSDPATVKWNRFLSDARYQYDGLGCFEGGMTYWSGVWRPTQNSIMRDNTGGFNAPSREAIWYRIHKLAYGSTWKYNYEDFVTYDSINRMTSASTSSVRARRLEPTYPPTAPPVIVNRRWNEAATGPKQTTR